MNAKNFRFVDWAGFGLGLVVLAMLAGCADSPPWSSTSKVPTNGQLQAALGRKSSFVYFTSYEIYYDRNYSQYTYWDGSVWITGTEPPQGISTDLLLASPSVVMNFHDAPEWHHAAVVRNYPRNWGRPEVIMASAQ